MTEGGAVGRAEMMVLGPAVVVVAAVGCGLVRGHGAGFEGGSERRETGLAAGVEAGHELDSAPVGGFGLKTAPEDELAGLEWLAEAVASAETGHGLVVGSGEVGFVELG